MNTITYPRINYRKKVACFGSSPATDIELLRRMRDAQVKREQLRHAAIRIGIYTASAALVVGLIRKLITSLS